MHRQLGKNGPGLRVAVADPERALVLRSDDGNWVWAFCLVPDGKSAPDSSAGTGSPRPERRGPLGPSTSYVMEPGSLVMERKMLLGIKKRAERLAREPESQTTPYHETQRQPTDLNR